MKIIHVRKNPSTSKIRFNIVAQGSKAVVVRREQGAVNFEYAEDQRKVKNMWHGEV